MKWIKLSAEEARALFDAASQMRDDFEDWSFDVSEFKTDSAKRSDAAKKYAAYESAMEKVKTAFK